MQIYKNPVLYADYSDPDVVRVGEDYFMVASSFTYFPGVPLLHSRDLVHWEIINYCIRSLPFEKYTFPSHGSGTWAPSIRYHEETFYVFVPLVDEGILVARSKDPYGAFECNMLWEGKGWIDPCPLWDDHGKAYMVFAYAKSRCGIKHRISVVEIDPQCRKLLGDPRVIFDGTQIAPTAEGPKFYKKDGMYYILFPAGGVSNGWQACLRGASVYGLYEYKVIMHQGNTAINGPHQGAWIDSPDGRDWFLHFQDVGELGRIIHLQPMCFIDGWPFIGAEQNGDGIGEPVTEWEIPAEGMPEYAVAQSDDFSSDRLGLQWQWQANPDETNYSLKENPGHLRLFCKKNVQKIGGKARENLLWYAPNVLTQIPQKSCFTVTAKIKLAGKNPGDFGGIGMLGHDYGYIGLYRSREGQEIRCYHGVVTEKELSGNAEEMCILRQPSVKDELWLRLCVRADKTYEFSYSVNGRHFIESGQRFKLSRGTWTGAKLCIWACARENGDSQGYCDFEFVNIE